MRAFKIMSVLSASICQAACAASAMNLPLIDGFQNNVLDSGWSVKTGAGAEVSVKDGWVALSAPASAVAHIERALGIDDVMFSARTTNFASIYLVWAPDVWCSFGKGAAAATGRFQSMIALGGPPALSQHSASIPWNAYYVRIVLGRDVIRFEFSIDGRDWFQERVIERPARLSGPPVFLAAGKTYSADIPAFSTSGGSAESSEGRQTCSLTDIRVQTTPPAMATMSSAERSRLGKTPEEPVMRQARESRADPTYASIVRHYPRFRYPRELVGVPEHPRAIGVDWLGRMDSSPGTAIAWFAIGDKAEPLILDETPVERRLLDGWIPIVTLKTERDSVRWEMTAFGWSEGLVATEPLWGYVSLKAKPGSAAVLPSSIAFCGQGQRLALDAALLRKSGQLFLRYKYPDVSTAEPVTAAEFAARHRSAARMWRQRIQPAARFSVPDRRVSEAYRAWLAYSMLNSKLVNGYVELHDGSGFYDMVYGYSMSLYAIAADQYGLHDLAERLLDTQVHFQSPDGLYTQEAGLPDHGAMLLSLAHHYQLTGDRQWLKRVSPAIIRAGEWVIRQREAGPGEGITRGLIKFRPYCDYPTAVFSYFGNIYCCTGLEQCAAALADVRSPEAARLSAEAASFRRDILTSMSAAVIKRDGISILPVEPDTQRLLKDSKYRGGDYYGLVGSCMLETDFLSPGDPMARLISDHIRLRGGLIAGVSEFMEGIDHAYTFGYLLNKIRQDDIRPVLLGFWSMLAFGMTRDTYSPVELTMIATGDNNLTLPHSYSCTMQLRLLRSMLVLEEGDTLWLARATPADWLRPGKGIAATAAPTTFGPVTYRITPLGDGTVRLRVKPPANPRLKLVRIRLRIPGGAPVAGVSGTGDVSFSDDTLTLRNPVRQFDLNVRFGKTRP